MTKTPNIIVLEGLDGVGKTSVAKDLAKRISGKYMASTSNKFNQNNSYDFANMQEHFSKDELKAQFDMYLKANVSLSEKLSKQIKNNEIKTDYVILDQYVLSNLAIYNVLIGTDLTMDVIKNKALIEPNHTFYLTASANTRFERLNEKSDTKISSDAFQKNIDLASKIDKEYERLHTKNYIFGETTEISVNTTPLEIVSMQLETEIGDLLDPDNY